MTKQCLSPNHLFPESLTSHFEENMTTATASNAWPLGGLARSIPKMDSLPPLSVAACLTIAIFDNFCRKTTISTLTLDTTISLQFQEL